MNIKIDSYKKFAEGKVRGICSVEFDLLGAVLTVKGVKVIDSPRGGHFYALPSRSVIDQNTGDTEYHPICAFFTRGDNDIFHQAMNEAFGVYFQKNPPPINADPSGFGALPNVRFHETSMESQPPFPPAPTMASHWTAPPTTQTDNCPF